MLGGVASCRAAMSMPRNCVAMEEGSSMGSVTRRVMRSRVTPMVLAVEDREGVVLGVTALPMGVTDEVGVLVGLRRLLGLSLG